MDKPIHEKTSCNISKPEGMRMGLKNRTVSEAAWFLCELANVGETLLKTGKCAGEIRPQHFSVKEERLYRRRAEGFSTILDRVSARFHEGYRHDEGCYLFGVSKRVLIKNVRLMVSADAANFLIDAIESAVAESLNSLRLKRELGAVRPCEVLIQNINETITPRGPILL